MLGKYLFVACQPFLRLEVSGEAANEVYPCKPMILHQMLHHKLHSTLVAEGDVLIKHMGRVVYVDNGHIVFLCQPVYLFDNAFINDGIAQNDDAVKHIVIYKVKYSSFALDDTFGQSNPRIKVRLSDKACEHKQIYIKRRTSAGDTLRNACLIFLIIACNAQSDGFSFHGSHSHMFILHNRSDIPIISYSGEISSIF